VVILTLIQGDLLRTPDIPRLTAYVAAAQQEDDPVTPFA
jgi:hypothetical protein